MVGDEERVLERVAQCLRSMWKVFGSKAAALKRAYHMWAFDSLRAARAAALRTARAEVQKERERLAREHVEFEALKANWLVELKVQFPSAELVYEEEAVQGDGSLEAAADPAANLRCVERLETGAVAEEKVVEGQGDEGREVAVPPEADSGGVELLETRAAAVEVVAVGRGYEGSEAAEDP